MLVASPSTATAVDSLTQESTRTDDVETYAYERLRVMSTLDSEDPRRDQLRSDVICACLPMARRAAGRFSGRGESLDDLVQVATVGLIKSVDRFDASRETPFVNYAMPTITGEIKRHFRDKSWSVRVSRRMQELHLDITRTIPELAQDLGRSPSVADLAARLEVSESDILAGIDCGQAFTARSLSTPIGDDDGGTVLADVLGGDDERMESAADRHTLRSLLADLPERERTILMLRFFENLTQNEIAEHVGVSQMHVSRLLSRTLGELRERLLTVD